MKTLQNTLILMMAAGLAMTVGNTAKAQSTKPTTGYAPVNGLKMYYEIYGQGDPIVLLHGSFMNIGMNYGELIPQLAKTHQVIALEMQGHGHTADIDRPISYKALADDVAGLLTYLKIDSANILGYSLGATVALQLAVSHPKLVKKIVFISSVYKSDGWIKTVQNAFAIMTADMLSHTPLKTAYDKVAPDAAHWNAFATNMIKFENTPFDLGHDNIAKIKAPILIIQGDNDGVDLAHTADLYTTFGGGVFGDMIGAPKSRLAILPGTTHVTVMMQTATLAANILLFLK